MPEAAAPVAAAPVESAASSESTESIVSSISADLSDAEASAEPVSGTTTTTGTTTAAAPTTTTPVTQAEKDELAEALGITADGTAKWTSRLAYSKVHKAVKALQAKAEEAHKAALKTHADENTNYKSQIDRFDAMVSNPDQLIAALAAVNPAYKRFISGQPAGTTTGVPQKIETMDDLQKVIDARVAAELAPIKQEREQRQAIEAAVPRVKAQIAEAESWPLFKESKTEIHAALKANPTWGLKDAYQHVVLPKLATNRDQMRQSLVEELKTRPHSTTVTTTTAGRTSQGGEALSTEDIVRNAARSIKDV